MPRNSKLHISVSSQEKAEIKRKALEIGMDVSSYCRFILTHARPKVTLEES